MLELNKNGEVIYTSKGTDAKNNVKIALAYATNESSYNELIQNAS